MTLILYNNKFYKDDLKNQELSRWVHIPKRENINLGGKYKMVKIDKSEYVFNDTLKADDLKKDKVVQIIEVKPVSTKFGEKRIAILNDETQIFLNALSLQNLAEGISDETDDWLNKDLTLTIETGLRTRNKPSLVLLAKEEQRAKK